MNIPHPGRRLSRLAVVQALYQMEMAATDIDTICLQYQNNPIKLVEHAESIETDAIDFPFFEDLVRGIVREQKEIDPKLSELLSNDWPLNRLDSTLRAILRAGAYELLFRKDIPPKSVITEYLEISHGFFGDEEPKMVNGLLDKLIP